MTWLASRIILHLFLTSSLAPEPHLLDEASETLGVSPFGEGLREGPGLEKTREERQRSTRRRNGEEALVPLDPVVDVFAFVQEAEGLAKGHVADDVDGQELRHGREIHGLVLARLGDELLIDDTE